MALKITKIVQNNWGGSKWGVGAGGRVGGTKRIVFILKRNF